MIFKLAFTKMSLGSFIENLEIITRPKYECVFIVLETGFYNTLIIEPLM